MKRAELRRVRLRRRAHAAVRAGLRSEPVHIECAGAGKAAALGRVVCVDCRLDDMKASLPASSAVERMAAKQLVLELLSRKESTARSNLDVERLQQHFLNDAPASLPNGAPCARSSSARSPRAL